MTEPNTAALPEVGLRIVLTETFECFPHGHWEPGTLGTVAVSESGSIEVKLDEHFPSLDEWNNRIIWYGHYVGRTDEEMIADFWSQAAPSTLRCDLPEVGTEVVLASDFESFPEGIWQAGERGTVALVDDECIGMKLDTHYPALDEWDNCLMWYGPNLGLSKEGMAASFWAKVEEAPAPTPGL